MSRTLQHDPGADRDGGMRLPARDLETAVCDAVADALADPIGVAAQAWVTITPATMHDVDARARTAAAALRDGRREVIRDLVARVQVQPDRVEILLGTPALARLLGQPSSEGAPATLTLASELRLTRTGRAVRLVQTNGAAVGPAQVDSGLVKLIARARGWWSELSDGELDVTALATREGLTTSYVSRVARLAFLAPEIVEAIARGQQPAALTSGVLTTPGAMPGAWPEQRNRYLGQS